MSWEEEVGRHKMGREGKGGLEEEATVTVREAVPLHGTAVRRANFRVEM